MNKEYLEIIECTKIQLEKLIKGADNLDNALTDCYQAIDALKFDIENLEHRLKNE